MADPPHRSPRGFDTSRGLARQISGQKGHGSTATNTFGKLHADALAHLGEGLTQALCTRERDDRDPPCFPTTPGKKAGDARAGYNIYRCRRQTA